MRFSCELDWDDDDEVGEGECAMCHRTMPLTAHHMIPKSEHARYIKKGLTRQFLLGKDNVVDICLPCHSAVHRSESNAKLADECFTLERISSHPKIASFITYASKQRISQKKR